MLAFGSGVGYFSFFSFCIFDGLDYNSLKEEDPMSVPRLLLLSLLISLCVATAAAQSSPNNNSSSSQPASMLLRSPQASTGSFQFQLPFLADRQSLDNEATMSGNAPLVTPPLDAQAPDSLQNNLTPQQDEKSCFTIRAYRVVRESPDSDTTRPAGYSTCQPTTRFQLKQAVETQVVVPH